MTENVVPRSIPTAGSVSGVGIVFSLFICVASHRSLISRIAPSLTAYMLFRTFLNILFFPRKVNSICPKTPFHLPRLFPFSHQDRSLFTVMLYVFRTFVFASTVRHRYCPTNCRSNAVRLFWGLPTLSSIRSRLKTFFALPTLSSIRGRLGGLVGV